MKYEKKPLSLGAQADLLLSRGLSGDRESIIAHLHHISLSRLASYLYPFRIRNDDNELTDMFDPGTQFNEVYHRYRFDRRLRILLLDGIERFEVSLRTQIINTHCLSYGPFGYTKIHTFATGTEARKFHEVLKEHDERYEQSDEIFVREYKTAYGEHESYLPLWFFGEIMSFGTVQRLYTMLNPSMQKSIAGAYGISVPVLRSWIHVIRIIRNRCAHHSRVWNFQLSENISLPPEKDVAAFHSPLPTTRTSLFGVLTIIAYLLSVIAPESKWAARVESLFEEFPMIPRDDMGIPEDWKNHAIWRSAN
jgi:abortive infection bacteriophage resistance protein